MLVRMEVDQIFICVSLDGMMQYGIPRISNIVSLNYDMAIFPKIEIGD